MSLDLGRTANASLPTDERLKRFSAGEEDPALVSLFYQFGRYLLISSSRPDNPLPSNSQGIWGDGLRLPWGCDYKSNINFEMNYWPVETANLSECHTPMLRMVENVVGTRQADRQGLFRRARLGHGVHDERVGLDRSRPGRPVGSVLLRRRVDLPAPVGALRLHARSRLPEARVPGDEGRERSLPAHAGGRRERQADHQPFHLSGERIQDRRRRARMGVRGQRHGTPDHLGALRQYGRRGRERCTSTRRSNATWRAHATKFDRPRSVAADS